MVTKTSPTPRLARKTPELRREHILDIASNAFLEEGYAATSMSTIAARLGGSKATLYKYFPSKEQLFEAVIEAHCAEKLAMLAQDSLPRGDIGSLLRAVGRHYIRVLSSPAALKLARLVHGEGVRLPEVARTFFRYGPDRAHAALEALLAEQVAAGHIRCADPALTARQFFGMVRGDLHMRLVCGIAPAPSDEEMARLIDHAVDLIAPALERAG